MLQSTKWTKTELPEFFPSTATSNIGWFISPNRTYHDHNDAFFSQTRGSKNLLAKKYEPVKDGQISIKTHHHHHNHSNNHNSNSAIIMVINTRSMLGRKVGLTFPIHPLSLRLRGSSLAIRSWEHGTLHSYPGVSGQLRLVKGFPQGIFPKRKSVVFSELGRTCLRPNFYVEKASVSTKICSPFGPLQGSGQSQQPWLRIVEPEAINLPGGIGSYMYICIDIYI